MAFKQLILEMMDPDSSGSIQDDLHNLITCKELNPDDIRKWASQCALIKIGLLDPNSDSFDGDITNLWNQVCELEKELPGINALILGMKTLLQKWARLNHVELRDVNSSINVADIDTAVDNFNKPDAVQSSELIKRMQSSGLLTESEYRKCLFNQRTSVLETAGNLMEAFGSARPNLCVASILTPEQLGIDMVNLKIYAAKAIGSYDVNDDFARTIHPYQIIECLGAGIDTVIKQFGNVSFTANMCNAAFCNIVYLLIGSILEMKTTPIEKLPYLRYLYRDIYYHGPNRYLFKTIALLTDAVIIANIEQSVFGKINSTIQNDIADQLRKLEVENDIEIGDDPETLGRIRTWINDLVSTESTSISKRVYPNEAIAKIRVLFQVIPGIQSSLGAGLDVKPAKKGPDTSGVESLTNRLQVDLSESLSLTEGVNFKSLLEERVMENHKAIRQCRMQSSSGKETLARLLREQKILGDYLEESYGTSRIVQIAGMDAVDYSEEDLTTPVITESFVIGI